MPTYPVGSSTSYAGGGLASSFFHFFFHVPKLSDGRFSYETIRPQVGAEKLICTRFLWGTEGHFKIITHTTEGHCHREKLKDTEGKRGS